MFKVPGWSVPTDSLKTQTTSTFEASNKDNDKTNHKTNRKSKRKRNELQDQKVTTDNVADLFRQYLEDGQSKSDNHNKGRKTDSNAGRTLEAAQTNAVEEDVPQKKRKTLKEKKREKKAKLAGSVAESEPPSHETKADSPAKTPEDTVQKPSKSAPSAKLTPLQSNMQQKLISSRFRHLNQVLYTTPSNDSKDLFSNNPGFFTEYHEGFRRQVQAWPENPIEGFITWIKVRGAIPMPGPPHKRQRYLKGDDKSPDRGEGNQEDALRAATMGPLPRHPASRTCTIADLGCGDAQLATVLSAAPPKPPLAKKLKLHIRSFDLAANSPLVEVSDISSLPVQAGTVDVAIFCLALMGTNWLNFVEEAYRILKWKGECWITEVSSRFNSAPLSNKNKTPARDAKTNGKKQGEPSENKVTDEDYTKVDENGVPQKASTDVSGFVDVLRRRGFELLDEPETNNKMFVRMRFSKSRKPTSGKEVKKPIAVDRPGWEPKKRFIDEATITAEEEAKVLKPCVYKQR